MKDKFNPIKEAPAEGTEVYRAHFGFFTGYVYKPLCLPFLNTSNDLEWLEAGELFATLEECQKYCDYLNQQ